MVPVHEQSSEIFDVSWIFMSSFSAHQIQLIIDTQKYKKSVIINYYGSPENP